MIIRNGVSCHISLFYGGKTGDRRPAFAGEAGTNGGDQATLFGNVQDYVE